METTSTTELDSKGYTYDMIAKRRFERRWIVPCLAPAISFLAILALGLFEVIGLGYAILVGSVFLLVTGISLVAKHSSMPRSIHTSLPLRKMKIDTPEWPILEESVYICDDSKTYFTSVVAEDPDNIPRSEQAASSNR